MFDLVIEFEIVRERRGFGLVRIGIYMDQPVPYQRAIRREMSAKIKFLIYGRTQEVKRKLHRWPLTGHVILKVGVDFFVAQIDFGRQREQDHIGSKTAQAKRTDEPGKGRIIFRNLTGIFIRKFVDQPELCRPRLL